MPKRARSKYFTNTLLLFLFLNSVFISKGQILTVEELVSYPHLNADKLSETLENKGWKKNTLEFIADSHYVRRTWVIPNTYNDLKSIILFYDYINDTTENHLIYQFSDKKAFEAYAGQFKKEGFKELNPKKKKKRRRKNQGKNIYEEREEVYYSEKHKSVIEIKEVFVYGMFSFLIYSYKSYSGIGKNVIQETGNKVPTIQD